MVNDSRRSLRTGSVCAHGFASRVSRTPDECRASNSPTRLATCVPFSRRVLAVLSACAGGKSYLAGVNADTDLRYARRVSEKVVSLERARTEKIYLAGRKTISMYAPSNFYI